MVTLRIYYFYGFFFFFFFFFFCPFLPILLDTDKNSNASAFDKQLHTSSTDSISEKELFGKIILLFVACGGVVKKICPPATCILKSE